jgi:hypothetical protein
MEVSQKAVLVFKVLPEFSLFKAAISTFIEEVHLKHYPGVRFLAQPTV